ncbi:MAG: hypothetical protein AAFY38_12015 [Pseudomonadota bacterium]
MTTQDATTIAERLLDETQLEMFGGDKALYITRFHLPLTLETSFGARYFETEAQLCDIHDALSAHFRMIGATDRVRRVVAAEFQSEGIIHSTHESRVIQQGVLLMEPYVAFSVLRRGPDAWQVADCSYAVSDGDAHGAVLAGRGG